MKRTTRVLVLLGATCALGYASAVISRPQLAVDEKAVVQREIEAMYAAYTSPNARAHARMPPRASITWLPESAVTSPSRHALPYLADGALVKRAPTYWPSQRVGLPWAYVFARGTWIPFVNRVYVGWQLGRLMGEGDERWFLCLPGLRFELRRVPLWYF
ncbi:MAG: hypothetical protein WA208_10330 [Thermoanaerobaculia bacterium]